MLAFANAWFRAGFSFSRLKDAWCLFLLLELLFLLELELEPHMLEWVVAATGEKVEEELGEIGERGVLVVGDDGAGAGAGLVTVAAGRGLRGSCLYRFATLDRPWVSLYSCAHWVNRALSFAFTSGSVVESVAARRRRSSRGSSAKKRREGG